MQGVRGGPCVRGHQGMFAPVRAIRAARPCLRAHSSAQQPSAATVSGVKLIEWLQDHGAPTQSVAIKTLIVPGAGRPLDVMVAARNLSVGEAAISVPEHMCITLDRVFESDFVAELLTTDKLSELACLTLYLMYEKKVGRNSFWYPYIKELDKQRARGPQAVESPLLWDEKELNTLLQGSPVVGAVKQRLAGIRKEYEELDTVWFMAGSLFNKYPFDQPTETFSFDLFRQAFAAVQASIVHLQGVPLAKRFALVPLGPPLLQYSSTCKCMLVYNEATKSVQLVLDREVPEGAPLAAWCGPQPNSRLLVNYGIVDENNPFDKLQMRVSVPTSDPLYQIKRAKLHGANLAVTQTFDLARTRPLPQLLLPYMRLAFATTEEQVQKVSLAENATPIDPVLERQVLAQLVLYFQQRLSAYRQPLWKDIEVVNDPSAPPRAKIAARLTKIEKSILMACQELLVAQGAPTGDAALAAAQDTTGGARLLTNFFDTSFCG